jgi:hypothetical protein
MNHGLTIKRIWDDDHIVELECTVDTGTFRGSSTCYTGPDELARFAGDLERFARVFEGTATLSAALSDGTKAVTIQVSTVDAARHAIASVKTGDRAWRESS